MDVDQALQKLGRWGRWQTSFYLLLCVTGTFPAVWHMLAIVFIGGIPTHTCQTSRDLRDVTIPRLQGEKRGQNDGYERCVEFTDLALPNATQPCSRGWTYWDTEGIGPTIVSEFDLVCKREALTNMAQTILVCGVLVGAMVFTVLADTLGRKPVFLFSLWGIVVLGVATAFAQSYVSFAALRFFTGMVQQGVCLMGFIMACELFPAKQRTFAGLAIQLFWATGMCVEALLGYLIRNWRHFQLALSIPWVFTVALYWILPESIPWLCANGRTREAEQILHKAAKMSGVTDMPEHILQHDDVIVEAANGNDGEKTQNGGLVVRLRGLVPSRQKKSKVDDAHYTLLDIFRNKKLRTWAAIMTSLWFVNTLVYYGLSLSTSELAGNRYLNFFLSCLVEIPAYASSIYIVEKWGRRVPLASYHILAGLALIIMIFVPSQTSGGHYLTLTLSMIGKFGITSSFGLVFLYAPEIFPTTVRSQAMGISSVGGRLGNVLAPFSALVGREVYWLPGLLFGVLSIVVGLLALLLPETLNRPLPQTIEDIENWSREPPPTNQSEDSKPSTPRRTSSNSDQIKKCPA